MNAWQVFSNYSNFQKILGLKRKALQMVLSGKAKPSSEFYWSKDLVHILTVSKADKSTSQQFADKLWRHDKFEGCIRGLIMYCYIILSGEVDPHTRNIVEGSKDNIPILDYQELIDMEEIFKSTNDFEKALQVLHI